MNDCKDRCIAEHNTDLFSYSVGNECSCGSNDNCASVTIRFDPQIMIYADVVQVIIFTVHLLPFSIWYILNRIVQPQLRMRNQYYVLVVKIVPIVLPYFNLLRMHVLSSVRIMVNLFSHMIQLYQIVNAHLTSVMLPIQIPMLISTVHQE